jgi:hypothetical protein
MARIAALHSARAQRHYPRLFYGVIKALPQIGAASLTRWT